MEVELGGVSGADLDGLFSTSDGGRSWLAVTSVVSAGTGPRQVVFTDAKHGFLLDDRLWVTDDGVAWRRP